MSRNGEEGTMRIGGLEGCTPEQRQRMHWPAEPPVRKNEDELGAKPQCCIHAVTSMHGCSTRDWLPSAPVLRTRVVAVGQLHAMPLLRGARCWVPSGHGQEPEAGRCLGRRTVVDGKREAEAVDDLVVAHHLRDKQAHAQPRGQGSGAGVVPVVVQRPEVAQHGDGYDAQKRVWRTHKGLIGGGVAPV
jgi:hypothetical protein